MIRKYSILRKTATNEDVDKPYFEALEQNDLVRAAKMVREYAQGMWYKIGPVYHGTNEEFTVFEEQSTSYGYFTSIDEDTAAFYGGTVLSLFLYGKEVDLDESFFEIAREAIWGDEEGRNEEATRDWFLGIYSPDDERFAELRAEFFKDAEESEDYTFEDAVKYESFKASDIEQWVKETEDPELWEDLEQAAPIHNPAVQEAYEAYGSQEFYMEHQDNFLRAAETMGYDIVHLTDPAGSTGGASSSTVFFNPTQAKLADAVTKDDAGNVIPLSKRFNPKNPDIRY